MKSKDLVPTNLFYFKIILSLIPIPIEIKLKKNKYYLYMANIFRFRERWFFMIISIPVQKKRFYRKVWF